MQAKLVQCPSCGQVLNVRNQNGETLKKFHCPKCNALLQVKFSSQQVPLEAKTYLGPKQPVMDRFSTQLSGINLGKTQLEIPQTTFDSNAMLVVNGRSYLLSEGQNIVGRKCRTSRATVQLETNDIVYESSAL